MKKTLAIFGSTGSIGKTTLSIVQKDNNFKIKLLTTNKNAKLILNQAIKFNVKDVIIENKYIYKKYYSKFKKQNIRLHLSFHNIKKIFKKKISYCVNAISGIEGLEPTLKIIPYTSNILIANKESIICGWNLIKKKLNYYNTNFIPIDSEHYSIWKLLNGQYNNDIDKIFLTASGGPFLNVPKKKLLNIKPQLALKHPNWKMGKKISIDSSNMMNKIFEFIEAKKIFNLINKKLFIVIHPDSFVHAIIIYKAGLIKILAHDTKMIVPISNALQSNLKFKLKTDKTINKLNNLNLKKPDKIKFPLLNLIKFIPDNESYFEIILITLNDNLVNKYLKGEINYQSISKNILKLIKKPTLNKYYKLKPKNIYDIKKMVNFTKIYLEKNFKRYEN